MSGLLRTLALNMAVAAALGAAPARAAVISYNEVTDPDLSGNSATPTALGTLDIGTNTVIGGIDCVSGCDVGDLHDYFNVTLSSGKQITSITVTLTNFAQSNGAIGHMDTNGTAISPITFDFNVNNGNNNTTLSLFSGGVVGPGTQGFHLGLSGGGGSADKALSFDYQVDIIVSEVSVVIDPLALPEPASLALFGAGLFGLGLLRRRRTH